MKRDRPSEWLRLRGSVDGVEKRHLLGTGRTRIGSIADNELVLPVRGVSRRHADLIVDENGVTVEDLGSKNGVLVNGVRVQRSLLQPGDEIGLGPVKLLLETVDPEDAELALEVDEPGRQAGLPEAHTTEASAALPSPLRWTQVIEAAVTRLTASREADLGGLLGVLVRELPCAGACVLEGGPGESRVLAARGVDLDLVRLDAAREHCPASTGSACEALLEPGEPPLAIGALVDADGRSLWLGVAGEFPGRAVSAPLLRTLVRLVALHRPEPVQDDASTPSTPEQLAFPEGYVAGDSAAMARLFAEIRPLAVSDLPVLIEAETGAGKEPLARTLHLSSPRRDGPFVAVNCAAIPAELLEAELFGVAKGAATGVAEREGCFRAARGGTLLLDEIGDMPLALQAKLLRALQEREVQPVGGTPEPTDVRVVATTNADLSARIEAASFRADLYYRIAGHTLRLPPLRERRDDIPQLVEALVRRSAKRARRSVRGVTVRALRALVAYDWPGNVRELEHQVLRLVHLCPDSEAIDFAMLPAHIVTGGTAPVGVPAPANLQLEPNVARLEEALIRQALEASDGNRSRAAKLLGLSRNGLALKMGRLKIEA